jgi:sulfate transport system ATP-binding protein
MTIFENVAFGLRVRPKATRPSDAEIKSKVTALLKLVQLDWIADRYPHQLSGGQRQRIALARALAVEPRVLLLDEPFGALDAKVRKELRRWLRRLHDEMHVTSVFVTHDQDEAMEVADRIVVMNQGRIEQVGSPDAVYDHPATPFVLQFLGDVNLFHGRTGHAAHGPGGAVAEAADDVHYVRPHELDVLATAADDAWPAELAQALTIGPVTRLEFKRDDGSYVDVELSRAKWQQLRHDLQLAPGSRAWLKPRQVTRFLASGAPVVADDPAAAI